MGGTRLSTEVADLRAELAVLVSELRVSEHQPHTHLAHVCAFDHELDVSLFCVFATFL